MATPVIDLRTRLRGAGFTEEQADAIAAGFEALDRRMTDLERRMDRLEGRMGVVIGLQLVTIGAVLAPYVAALLGD